ncbi:MAG: nucleotide exchange factor GrpE [Helicobacter sp.]|nr:nucleotide exchange factor GrpE [Helicobacteraceae bacterium]MDY3113017.1 nucleotide exchange factor GrpE [Helicobacter sp.]
MQNKENLESASKESVESCDCDNLDSTCEENDENNQNCEASIDDLQAQIAELKEENLRTYADFENTKKRLMRDKDLALEYAYEKIAKDLLPSIDSLEIALKSVRNAKEISDNAELLSKIEEGISLTLDNLLKSFAKHGIEPIATDGAFDPNFHDAIMQVDSDSHESGQIVSELQKGYKYKERVLRPSMISIAK